MKIKTVVTIKQVLTEQSKYELEQTFIERKMQLEKEVEQLRFEKKKMEKSRKYDSSQIQQYFLKEINVRIERINLLKFQLEQLHILPLGTELVERETEGMIDVQIGDNWNEIKLGKTIIVKDGIIIDIR